jgi:hypothetical protein
MKKMCRSILYMRIYAMGMYKNTSYDLHWNPRSIMSGFLTTSQKYRHNCFYICTIFTLYVSKVHSVVSNTAGLIACTIICHCKTKRAIIQQQKLQEASNLAKYASSNYLSWR